MSGLTIPTYQLYFYYPQLRKYTDKMCDTSVHTSTIHNCQELETAKMTMDLNTREKCVMPTQ